MVTTTLLSQTRVDQALLAAPALILLAVALLFLRLFPLLVRGMAWLAGRVGSAWLVVGLWHVGRNPMPYALPTLLLMLASAIAMFAANFGATLARSYEDRAAYAAGSALRVSLGRAGPDEGAASAVQEIAAREGVPSSPVLRANTSFPLQIFHAGEFGLLAVDPATFPQVAWHREDFSNVSLDGVMAMLRPDSPERLHGIPMPVDAAGLGVWALPADPRRNMQVFARVADAAGQYSDVHLGTLDKREWTLLSGRLPDTVLPGTKGPQPPFRLVALHFAQPPGADIPAGAVYLDSIETTGASPVTLVDLRDLAQSAVIHDGPASSAESLESNTAVGRPERGGSAVFVWGPGSPMVTRGLAFRSTTSLDAPLRAVASRAVLEREGLAVGDHVTLNIGGHSALVYVAGMVDFFPTLDPYDGGFFIMNLPAVLERLNTITQLYQSEPNEVWLLPQSAASRNAVLGGLGQSMPVVDREKLLAEFQADPLVAAGWTGALRIAFLAVLFTTLMGFSAYSLVHAQRRRVEFALLRSLGFSSAGVAGVVVIEQALVVVLGMALGSWLGAQVTALVMPFLGLSEEGTQVLPPYTLAIDWRAVLIVYGVMAVVFMATTVALIGLFSRAAIQRALRFGEL